ncbi:MAG: 50S ribosomal protein L10 [bacterium]
MAITKDKKKKIVEDLKDKISRQKVMVFTDFTGTKAKDLLGLRKKIREEGGDLKVAKKTLAQLALKDKNFGVDIKNMKGEIAFVFGFTDEVSPARALWQFSEKNPGLKIVGGILENKFIEAEKVLELAKLPAKEILLAKLASSIKSPVSNFVYVLEANIKGLINVLAKAKV